MYPGNRPVSIAALTLLGSLWALAAGDAREDGTEAMYFVPEVTAHASADLPCGDALRFETIQLTGGGPMVGFEWTPASGELSFRLRTTLAGVTLPERFVTAASVQPVPSCESR